MKPIYVILIAIASAVVGGLIGAGIGGVTGGIAGGTGGAGLGFEYGVCQATDIAKSQKFLAPAQADQVTSLAYAEANKKLAGKGMGSISSPNCQEIYSQVDQMTK